MAKVMTETWRGSTHLERTGHEATRNKHGQCTICLPRTAAATRRERQMATVPSYFTEGEAAVSWDYRAERTSQTHLRRTGHERVAAGRQCAVCLRLAQRVANAKRRAERAGAKGSFGVQDLVRQLECQGDLCYWCNGTAGDSYHIDHIVPLTRGGSNSPANIVIACPTCNTRKHNTAPAEFAKSMWCL